MNGSPWRWLLALAALLAFTALGQVPVSHDPATLLAGAMPTPAVVEITQ